MKDRPVWFFDNRSSQPEFSIVYQSKASMAKRRNLKKEKAERNQAYARKFRKRPANGRMFRSRFRSPSGNSAEEDNEETTAAAP
jgi:hypothetical protein